ncbi:PorP/SprF family type IX secretion system membrane protein [Aquimarina agarivorans]|uniref:PorP/SprF family type IX secretion system membrane protein n=1 Tax=Aquimarina agarivorans TaxID=980584 RepID=UPI000248E9EB|nr:type IX secretion system membrane protein PorP/SprF [Aquimarina agarivorans]
MEKNTEDTLPYLDKRLNITNYYILQIMTYAPKLKLNFKPIFGIVALLTTYFSFAQEGLPVYSDYLTDNYYLIHPSMAGASNCSQIRLTARRSWLGQTDAPSLQTLSINGRVGRSSGLGVNAFADTNGFHKQNGIYGTYAHHLLFSRDEVDINMLSFGLSAGVLQYQLDETSFIAAGDPLVGGSTTNQAYFNMDFGFSYFYRDFFTHFTAKNLIENQGLNETDLTSNLRRFLLSMGVNISKFNSPWQFEPSLLAQYRQQLQQTTVDMNIKVYRKLNNNRTAYLGVSYRRAVDAGSTDDSASLLVQEQLSYVSPLFGVNLGKLKFAYTYTKQLNEVVFSSDGFHQITLGYDFGCRKQRYHCNCPALN